MRTECGKAQWAFGKAPTWECLLAILAEQHSGVQFTEEAASQIQGILI